MPLLVAINHVTHYHYDRPVSLGPQVVRLRPAPHSRTRILDYRLRVTPATHLINWQQDPLSNFQARLVFPDKATELRLEVELVAAIVELNPFDFFLEPRAATFPFSYQEAERVELLPFLGREVEAPALADFLRTLGALPQSTVALLVEINRRLCREIVYVVRVEPGVQEPAQTLARRAGSCRDSSWLLIHLLRHLGFAARFVSGYLVQLGAGATQSQDASRDEIHLHAWCEVYLPGAGWIGLDPTSGLFTGESHIPLACGPDPASAAPVTGLIDVCRSELTHHMSVTRLAK